MYQKMHVELSSTSIYIRIAADSLINNTISHPLPVILVYEDGLKIHQPNKENKTILGTLIFMYII